MNSETVPVQNVAQQSKSEINLQPKYQDRWATPVFGAGVLAFMIMSIISFSYYKLELNRVDLNSFSQGYVIALFSSVVIIGAVTSLGYFFLLSRYAGSMITATLATVVILEILLALYYFIFGAFIIGLLILIVAIVKGCIFWSWRNRIPFAKVVLKHSTKIINHYPGIWSIAFGGLIVQAGILVWLLFAIIYWTFAKNLPRFGWGYVFLIFMHHWMSAVVTSAVHMSIAGVSATAYFKGRYEGKKLVAPTENVVAGSINRALTTSFGTNW